MMNERTPSYDAVVSALARARMILERNLAHEPSCGGNPCRCGRAVILSQLDPNLPETGIRFPSPSGDWGTITGSNFGPIDPTVEIRKQPEKTWVCGCHYVRPMWSQGKCNGCGQEAPTR